jgi:hypothetical protein
MSDARSRCMARCGCEEARGPGRHCSAALHLAFRTLTETPCKGAIGTACPQTLSRPPVDYRHSAPTGAPARWGSVAS